jgi:carbamoyl-phosphate synthase small subunit
MTTRVEIADARRTAWPEPRPTALLVLADGTVIEGHGIGAEGSAVGEVCFNTAMTGYQEILTDPSYAGQIITFTFPHIGNVGVNDEDIETVNLAAASGVRGCVLRTDISDPSSYRSTRHFDLWLKARGIIGIAGIDTRALTGLIRTKGMPNATIVHHRGGDFDRAALLAGARAWPGSDLVGLGQGLWPPRGAAAPRRCRRLRHQTEHPPAPRRPWLPRHRVVGAGDRRRHPRAPARRRLPVQRTR